MAAWRAATSPPEEVRIFFGRQSSTGAIQKAQQLPLPMKPLSESAAQPGEQIGEVVGRLRPAPVALAAPSFGLILSPKLATITQAPRQRGLVDGRSNRKSPSPAFSSNSDSANLSSVIGSSRPGLKLRNSTLADRSDGGRLHRRATPSSAPKSTPSPGTLTWSRRDCRKALGDHCHESVAMQTGP